MMRDKICDGCGVELVEHYYHECCGVIVVPCFHGCAECFKCEECLPKLRAAGSLGVEGGERELEDTDLPF
jgi:hypothetical protein